MAEELNALAKQHANEVSNCLALVRFLSPSSYTGIHQMSAKRQCFSPLPRLTGRNDAPTIDCSRNNLYQHPQRPRQGDYN